VCDVAAPGNKFSILNGRVRFTVVEKKIEFIAVFHMC
jgi:hypothetical protein